MVAPTCVGTTLPSSGSVPSAFWEMLNWGAVDRILWIEHLSEGTRNSPWRWQCNAETCRSYHTELISKCKGKAIPLQALTGSEGSRRLRLPDFKTISTWKWQGCQPNESAAFTPRKYYSFLLEAESTPGPKCGRKVYFNEKFQWHHRESFPWPSGL
jgi:hypothetical protein